MNQILPDGRLVFADNPNGYFFDMSIVIRPADKIAWGMAKVASTITVPEMPYSSIPGMQMDSGEYYFTKSAAEIAEGYQMDETIERMEKAGEVKTSDIDKEVPGKVEDVIRDDPDKNFRLKGLRIAIHAEEPIPTDMLNSMAATYSLEDIIGTLLSLGVIPTPREFQRSVLCSCGQKPYADALDEEGLVFDTEMPVKEATAFGPANLGFNAILAEEIGKSGILEKRSYWPQHLAKRASLIKKAVEEGEFFEKYPIKKNPTPIRKVPEDLQENIIARGINRSDLVSRMTNPRVLIGDESRYIPGLPEGMTLKRDANPLIPIAALAALYAGVQFMAGATNSPLGKAMRQDPRIAAGVFGAAAALTWIGRKIGIHQPVIKHTSPRERVGRPGHPKTASILSRSVQMADDIVLQAPPRAE